MAKKPAPKPEKLNFAAIEANYRNIEGHRTKIFAACTSEAERQAFFDSYNAARDAYWAAVASVLKDNHAFVQSLRKDLVAGNAAVKKDLQDLQDIAQTLKLIAETTKLAAALVTAAAV